MQRRDFITLLGCGAAWPLFGCAQQEPMRRIGVLVSFADSDIRGQSWLAAFRQRLQELGWTDDHNVRIEYRFTAGDTERMRTYATELADFRPDVILAAGTGVVGASRLLLSSMPVVFVQVTDPVGAGFVTSLAHPGGNMTGFTSFEYSFGGKWLELLREVQPGVTQVAVIENPDNANYTGYLRTIEETAATLQVGVLTAKLRHSTELDSTFETFAGKPGIGLIVPPDPFTLSLRRSIVDLTIRYRIPSIYAFSPFVLDGGLMSYGVDNKEMYRGAASYVDRILRGEKPADLPVQASNKFELMINLKAAKMIGLTVPPTLAARADLLIE
jgi:putative ABC transport system substrate-binding protein